MKKKFNSNSAFFNLRALTGVLLVLSGAFLALVGFGKFTAQARQAAANSNPLIPVMFDCASIQSQQIYKQENLRAGALMIYCGQAVGGSVDPDAIPSGQTSQFVAELLAPALGTSDVDLITGADTGSHITQSETFVAANPDNPNEIVVAFNDSRNVTANPINISGASVSTDGGATFTRLTKSNGQSPFSNTLGDPVILYNRPTQTWFTAWIDLGCGSQGLGGYKSTNPSDPNSWTHYCAHTGFGDDRESGWADNNPNSPFYGNMYLSWNDFGVGGNLKVRFSTDNGSTWTERQLAPASPFIRDVQIVGDPSNGTVFVAGMNENNGGLTNRNNIFYRSTDGGNSWTQTYSGPTFPGPGRTTCPNSYFACMFQTGGSGYWRHMGWGQHAINAGVVSYVYDSRNTSNGDPADVFYIRSTDNGATFSAPFKLNTDSTTKANWQPNISAGADGSLLAVWYDERGATQTCVKGSTTVGCYQMWGRKSTDNGATWQPDQTFSDVMTPLPGQPDSSIIAEYAGDYDYSFASPDGHLHTWVDGRVAVNNASQQDAFFDQEAIGGGNPISLRASVRVQGTNHNVRLRWRPADGGQVNVIRNGATIGQTADDGTFVDHLGTQTGSFTYQVCETDSGDCSNEVTVQVQ